MKDLVYSIPNDTIEVLKNGWKMLPQQFVITEECWKEWKNHCIDNNGGHFEHFCNGYTIKLNRLIEIFYRNKIILASLTVPLTEI
jgi:hypothetical protein